MCIFCSLAVIYKNIIIDFENLHFLSTLLVTAFTMAIVAATDEVVSRQNQSVTYTKQSDQVLDRQA
jgi:hypothetical protein